MTTSLLPPLITSLRTNSNSNQSSIFFSPPFLSSGMERKGLISNNMKGQNMSSSSAVCCTKALHGRDVQNSNNKKIIVNKDEWGTCGEDVLSNGFSWPPRAYICTFCSREFKSAQALGGHMNVHRRDRARLRQSPPPPPSPPNLPSNSPNPKPSPKKPNLLSSSFPFISSSPPTGSKAIFGILPSLASHSGSKKGVAKDLSGPETLDKIAARMTSSRSFLGCDKFTREEDYINGFAKSGISSVSLDLEIGRLGDSKGDVDLELRLGCS